MLEINQALPLQKNGMENEMIEKLDELIKDQQRVTALALELQKLSSSIGAMLTAMIADMPTEETNTK